jgi:hypothetical protein
MSSRPSSTSEARLDAMVEEATVDCYNEDEQVTGLFTMIEDNLALPFQTTVLGMAVSVTSVDLSEGVSPLGRLSMSRRTAGASKRTEAVRRRRLVIRSRAARLPGSGC